MKLSKIFAIGLPVFLVLVVMLNLAPMLRGGGSGGSSAFF